MGMNFFITFFLMQIQAKQNLENFVQNIEIPGFLLTPYVKPGDIY